MSIIKEKENKRDKELFIKYAPIVLVVLSLFLEFNLFVTPQALEAKHREILQDIDAKYSTKEQTNDLKNQILQISVKIDKIYDIISTK